MAEFPVISSPKLSVVVPLYNEFENVDPLVQWIMESLEEYPDPFELVLVDDGSSDGTWAHISAAARTDRRIRGIQLVRNTGQTAAMMAGFEAARGSVVVSLDGDLQNDPRDIRTVVERLEDGYDLVCGWRMNRQDAFLLRKVPSWFANRLIRWLTGVPIRDNGCSLKAYRKDLLSRLTLYSDQHRFIPALSASFGARITEVGVRHHARQHGQSKYGISRTAKVLADLLTLKMITTFRAHPLLGFGIGSGLALGVAVLFAGAWLIAFTQFGPTKAEALVLPGISLLWLGVSFYFLMLGLIAEVVLRAHADHVHPSPVAREI